ncbi:DUF1127 domain-containing protein [Marinomonas sp. M1K-6]|uniref:DUF1127 domain-containing protein n=1 Tax=Marinomonas profundi TaxID=2726122 RepID=A0A847R3D2_9GAMM|nr:DUF1127 domain-containing protein [Marinomonas profundi]NLQ16883.1 DUF1127 domain-containing protein [Marinomonas profundi]UDV02615.1 DUF1127 domain-containing protein [Marinomonas profundi]
MLVVSLMVCLQHSAMRFKTRKKLASLSAQQLADIGMTKERQKMELAQASVKGFVVDLLAFFKK